MPSHTSPPSSPVAMNQDSSSQESVQDSSMERANRDLKNALDQVAKAHRMKSEFLANMSHELRSPLNDVLGFTQLLLGRAYGEINRKQEEAIQLISESAHTLLEHINSILDLSKLERGDVELHSEDFELTSLIDEIVKSYSHRARGRPVKIRADRSEELISMTTDKIKVRQILTNLVANAFKFTKRGTIRISTRYLVDEQAAEILVEDTGIGIRKEDLEVIFEPFRQADGSSTREFGGTGLGLAITRTLAQSLGGEISVTSAVGVGSTFRVLMPLVLKVEERSE